MLLKNTGRYSGLYSIDADPKKISGRSSVASIFSGKKDYEKLAGKVGSVQINNHNIFHNFESGLLQSRLKVGSGKNDSPFHQNERYVQHLIVHMQLSNTYL
jgi:hypothetical protein